MGEWCPPSPTTRLPSLGLMRPRREGRGNQGVPNVFDTFGLLRGTICGAGQGAFRTRGRRRGVCSRTNRTGRLRDCNDSIAINADGVPARRENEMASLTIRKAASLADKLGFEWLARTLFKVPLPLSTDYQSQVQQAVVAHLHAADHAP